MKTYLIHCAASLSTRVEADNEKDARGFAADSFGELLEDNTRSVDATIDADMTSNTFQVEEIEDDK